MLMNNKLPNPLVEAISNSSPVFGGFRGRSDILTRSTKSETDDDVNLKNNKNSAYNLVKGRFLLGFIFFD